MMRGFFITFEGPEGSGKSTHIALLAGELRRRKRPVIVTREPGGTRLSGAIRKILLGTRERLSPVAELLLYEADRAQHMKECVLPALKSGKIVLCDRFADSTIAYQGYGRGLGIPLIRELNKMASQGRRPDLTILLDVPVEEGLKRARWKKKGHDRLERAGMAFHQRVRQGFLRLAAKEPRRFRVVRQQRDIESTQESVRSVVFDFMKGRHPGDV